MLATPDLQQLPFLLRLLDDPSSVVQAEVDAALARLGPQLNPGLDQLEATPAQRQAIHTRLLPWRCQQLKQDWANWLAPPEESVRLEQAHRLISRFQMGLMDSREPAPLLDRLAEGYREEHGPGDPDLLARYLFAQRLSGVTVDYYHPHNSSLVHVLLRGRGIPISLCSVFILVGHRLGLEIQGCNFPSHFLARCKNKLYDCFQQGRTMDETLLGDLSLTQMRDLIERPCSTQDLMCRVLRNLVGAHVRREERVEADLFSYLLADLTARDPAQPWRPLLPEPTFYPGQLVRHRRKGYRGVVVHYALRTGRPDYVVLVHRSSEKGSWAPEEELEEDDLAGPVAHASVDYFFSKFEGGRYFRNGRPWEG